MNRSQQHNHKVKGKGQSDSALSLHTPEGMLSVFLFSSVFVFGLFPYWCAFFAGVFLCLLLWRTVKKEPSVRLPVSKPVILITVVVAFYGISVFWAIDRGMAFLGFLKYLVPLLYLLLVTQKNINKEKLLNALALSGVYSVIFFFPLSMIPAFHDYFLIDGRFSGPFMYANTYAMFLLASFVLICTQKQRRKRDHVYSIVLVLGILFTGSRGVFVFLGLALLILMFRNWKVVAVPTAACLILVILSSVVLDAATVIERSFHITFSAGEWLSRLAYYQDGLGLIAAKPWGLGHLGWWYYHPVIQTAVYDVRFIHSWPLQVALDVGIVPALLMLIAALLAFVHRENKFREKLLLILLLGHGLIDFDLNFLPIVFLILLLIPSHPYKEIAIPNIGRIFKTVCICLPCLFVWLGLSTLFSFCGWDEAAVSLYPWYTEAMEKLELRTADAGEAGQWSHRIVQMNPYVFEAYNLQAKMAAQKKDWLTAIASKEKFLAIRKFYSEDYDELLQYYHFALQKAAQEGNVATCIQLAEEALSIPAKMETVKQSLGTLAYQLAYQPTLSLSEQSERFIAYLHEFKQTLLQESR